MSVEATRKQTTPGQLALQKGLLDAAQLDIIETLLRPTEVVPGYEILDVLGRGGMGVVYRARQLNLDRIVALKTMLISLVGQPTALERLRQEAHVVARLTHPHIVAAYDFGRHEGRLYFAMELVVGEDVSKLIRRQGPLDEWAAWGLVRQAAAGLAHAAQHGIVHRDIKPANLLLVEPPLGLGLPAGLPMVKIADFGLAQLATATDERTRLTSANETVGSPNYMSPEQLLGRPLDLRTDIFSLGASAFHMLVGKPPQAGKNLAEIIAARLSGQPEPQSELRPDVSRGSVELIAAMMAHVAARSPRRLSRAGATDRCPRAGLARQSADHQPRLRDVGRRSLHADADCDAHRRPIERPAPQRLSARRRWLLGAGTLAAIALLAVLGSLNQSPGRRDLVPLGPDRRTLQRPEHQRVAARLGQLAASQKP